MKKIGRQTSTRKSMVIAVLFVVTIPSTLSEKCAYIGYRGKSDTTNTSECSKSHHCRKPFSISYVDIPPYSTSRIFERILQTCCHGCANITIDRVYTNITEVRLSHGNNNTSDLLLPFLGRAEAVELYSYHFIPFTNVPHAYYMTKNHHSHISQVIDACLNLYQLIIVCLLAAVISGFVIWALETRYENDENFSPSFCTGVFEGFWWSFVSMTTVGYGDTLVRSVPAKIFSVAWILVGIIMFCFLTSLVTAELMIVMEPHHDTMKGARVGVLKYRDSDAALIVSEGGIVVETQGWNFYSDVLMLMGMLRRSEIEGLVMDKYTLMYTKEYVNWKKHNLDTLPTRNQTEGELYDKRKDDIEFFLHGTRMTTKIHEQQLAYGVLVKNIEDYNYLNNAVRDNRFSLEVSVGSEMNEMFPRETSVPFTQVYFYQALKVEGVGIALIVCVGAFYELYHRHKARALDVNGRKEKVQML